MKNKKGGNYLVSLNLPNGSQVHFIREEMEGEMPRIGMMESIKSGEAPWLPLISEEFAPTPLEVFRTIAQENEKIPDILHEDHARARKNQPHLPIESRRLALPENRLTERISPPSSNILTIGLSHGTDVGTCLFSLPSDAHLQHLSDTGGAFGGALPNHGHAPDVLDHSVFGVTGFSSRRSFSMCNVAGYVKSVSVEYQWIQNVWVNVPIFPSGTFPGQSLFYYSDSWPLIFQYRMKVISASVTGNTYLLEGSW